MRSTARRPRSRAGCAAAIATADDSGADANVRRAATALAIAVQHAISSDLYRAQPTTAIAATPTTPTIDRAFLVALYSVRWARTAGVSRARGDLDPTPRGRGSDQPDDRCAVAARARGARANLRLAGRHAR